MDKTIRTFIAIELDASIQKALQNIQDQLKKAQCEVKWVKPENIHVTLKFLGDISSDQVELIEQILERTLAPFRSFPMEITHVGAFPKIENPHIIWVGTNPQQHTVKDMALFLEKQLEMAGFKKEDRDFAPHITIGRLKLSTNKPALVKAIKSVAIAPPLLQLVQKITLFKSTLSSQGSIYEALRTVQLK